MEPESLLPCSKEPSTGPNPEPYQLSQYQPILSVEDPADVTILLNATTDDILVWNVTIKLGGGIAPSV
jgi:hypothetical protein